MERTLALIKPDATLTGQTGAIIQRIEQAGFRIRAMKMVRLTHEEAEGFYAVHRARPFFASLTAFMSSGPIVALVLEAPDAIRKWRAVMGATDPAKADAGTIRKDFATSIERNATHGSDAPEAAAFELGYFFAGVELTEAPAAAATSESASQRPRPELGGGAPSPERGAAASGGGAPRAVRNDDE